MNVNFYYLVVRSAGGKFIDASPEFEQQVRDEMEKLKKQFGATADFDKFPTFNFIGWLIHECNIFLDFIQFHHIICFKHLTPSIAELDFAKCH